MADAHSKAFKRIPDSNDSIFRQFSDTVSDVFWIAEPTGALLYASPGYEALWGCSAQALQTDPTAWLTSVAPQDKIRVQKAFETLPTLTNPLTFEYRILHPDGTTRDVYDRAFPIRDPAAHLHRIIGIATDITEQKKLQNQINTQYQIAHILSESDSLKECTPKILRILCEHFDWDFGALWINEQVSSTHAVYCVALWHSPTTLGHLEKSVNPTATEFPLRIFKEKQPIWITNIQKDASLSSEIHFNNPNFHTVCALPILLDGAEDNLFGVLEFLSTKTRLFDEPALNFMKHMTHKIGQFARKKHSEAQLKQLAHYDLLTGLVNRSVLFDVIYQAIQCASAEDFKMAILFLDLDRFKFINDTYGHDIGDSFLQIVGERLRARIRKPDTIARLGGDEFVIVLSNIAEITAVDSVAHKILEALSAPFFIKGHECWSTVSIGISLFPQDGSDVSTLLNKADIAMYQAKALGGNHYQFYTTETLELAQKKIATLKRSSGMQGLNQQ